IDRILRVITAAGRMRAFGDAYAYHLLAAGKMESVIEAKIQIWDVAALSLIVEEAGGKVTDLAGNKLTLESTSIIASNGSVHDELVQLIKG
ncbi:MAG TPA: inositol monophosphatase family protein, partial [candidate division Zixibacteria bacterium]|nr:inositol monophosphatase family protein [candidate division Zixibacteria bacterium]